MVFNYGNSYGFGVLSVKKKQKIEGGREERERARKWEKKRKEKRGNRQSQKKRENLPKKGKKRQAGGK